MDHKKSRKVLQICCWIGVALIVVSGILLLLSERGSTALLVPTLGSLFAGVAVVIIGVILAYAYMRCPHCEGPLYYRGAPKPNFCPHCGKPIEW